MNAQELATQATQSTANYRHVLSEALCHKLELGFVALWLDNQDETVQANAAITACKAIAQLRQSFNSKSNS